MFKLLDYASHAFCSPASLVYDFIRVAQMSLTNSIAKCYHIVAANMYQQKKYRADYYTPIEKRDVS